MNNSYLCHYGILGQKWGVRRYQNDDGSLTEAGKKRYLKSNGKLTRHGRKILNDEYNKRRVFDKRENSIRDRFSSVLKEHGYIVSNKGADTIKKGSVVKRVAGDEDIDTTRKYVSITDDDTKDYESYYYQLPIKGKNAYSYDYELTKDAKVATYNNVMKYTVNKYGKVKLKDLGYDSDDFSMYGKSEKERLLRQVSETYGNQRVKDLYKESAKLNRINRYELFTQS